MQQKQLNIDGSLIFCNGQIVHSEYTAVLTIFFIICKGMKRRGNYNVKKISDHNLPFVIKRFRDFKGQKYINIKKCECYMKGLWKLFRRTGTRQ